MRHLPYSLLALWALLLGLSSCQDSLTETHYANVPVFMTDEELRQLTYSLQPAQSMEATGKIYVYENYLLINEPYLGIHIFNNSNPAAPAPVGFIPIPGNIDLAVQNDLLYADSFADLLTFDISNPASPQFLCRSEDAFTNYIPTVWAGYDEELPSVQVDFTQGRIVRWERQLVTEDMQVYAHGDPNNALNFVDAEIFTITNFGTSSTGTGGSMARFTITGQFLYTLQVNQLDAWKLNGTTCPDRMSTTTIWQTCETIFPYNNHLFLGTTTGMLVYSLAAPENPAYVSQFDHIMACDPVVVEDDKAYVTLRSNTMCWGTVNELIVLDVSNLYAPVQLAVHPMTNPHGLAISNGNLFVCDGEDGLKAYTTENVLEIPQNLTDHLAGLTTYDVIALNDLLIVSATEGIYQYNAQNMQNIEQLSFIPVN